MMIMFTHTIVAIMHELCIFNSDIAVAVDRKKLPQGQIEIFIVDVIIEKSQVVHNFFGVFFRGQNK